MALIGTMKYLTIGDQTYEIAGDELQIASASTLGGIKVGSGLSIDATTGVLSTSITESDPVFAASAAAGITSTDISNWNAKSDTDEKLKWTASTSSNTYYPLQSTSTATTSTANTLNGINFYQYYNTAGGYRRLNLGNATAWKSTGGAYGTIRLYGAAATYYGDLVPGVLGTTSGDGHISANRTWMLPDKTGTIALTSDIPTVPTKTSDLTNDSNFVTSSGVTSITLKAGGGISLDADNIAITSTGTRTISHSDTSNQGSSSNSGRTYIQSITLDTYGHVTGISTATETIADTQVSTAAVTSGTSYYPVVGTDTTSAATKFYDKTGIVYVGTDGTAGGTNGNALLTLGNSTASSKTGWKKGTIRLYGTTVYYTDLVSGEPSANRTITLPDKTGTIALTSDIPTVPTTVSSFTNDAGYLTSYTESDPIFTASAAAGITSTDISNWNNKVSDDKTWNGITLDKTGTISSGSMYLAARTSTNATTAYQIKATLTPESQKIAMYDSNAYLNSTTPSANDNSTKVATTAYVDSAITALPEPMIFKGSLGTGGTITSLPTAAASNEGHTYKVITDGTYASQSAKVGDTFISDGNTWVLIPSGDEPSGTVTSIGVSNATNGGLSVSGSPVTSSGTITIGHSNVLTSAQTTSAVYPIKIDKNGHISEYGSAVAIPTKVSDLTNDSGFITSYTDEKLKWTASTSSNTYYPLQSTSTATTSTANTLNGINFYQYYNTAGGYRRLNLGNSTAWKSTGGAYGTIRLYGAAATYYGDLVPGVLGTTSGDGHISANRTWTLPDKTGTLAITDDIPSVGFSNIESNSATIALNGIGYTFLRSYTETDPVFSASAASGITATDISNWNAKSNTDEKLKTVALTSGTTYYPILATGANAAANRQVDSTLLGLRYISTAGTTSTVGTAVLGIGNGTSSGYADNEQGVVRLYGTSVYYTDLVSGALLSNKTITLPNGTGTLALTSDIVQSNWSEANTNAASYIQNKPTIPSISLNGSSTTSASFYAPTTAGTSGYYLKSSGSGAPTWAAFPTIPTDTNTTYTLTNALSSHKFTWTFTAGGSGSGSTTTTAELVAGTGITLTDDTTNKKITIASSVTNTDEKLKVEALSNTTTAYYPVLTTSTTSAENKQYSYLLKAYFNDNSYNSYNLCIGNGVGIKGRLILANAGSSGGYTSIDTSGTTDRIITLPNKTGTIALTSDIPTVFVGSTSSTNGTQGLVPAPLSTDTDKYLKADGTWDIPAARWV